MQVYFTNILAFNVIEFVYILRQPLWVYLFLLLGQNESKGVSMTGKYHYIYLLAEMTAADIVKNENEWTRFRPRLQNCINIPLTSRCLICAQMGSCSADTVIGGRSSQTEVNMLYYHS